MRLIYTDTLLRDIGTIEDYTLDLAFGKDENDFELSVGLSSRAPRLESGSYVYIDGTEYGGIIDGPSVDTYNKQLIYRGRTYHGIMDSKYIIPPKDNDYYTVTDTARNVVNNLLNYCELGATFYLRDCPDLDITSYTFPRYVGVYQGLRDFCLRHQLKLHLTYDSIIKKIAIDIESSADYASNEEWDSSQYNFQIAQDNNKVNHLICLGAGELKDRAVIHLFTNENGIVQKYAKIDNPLKDADYILDTSNQILKGNLDRTEILVSDNASIATNYEVLLTKPETWVNTYYNYYDREIDAETGEARYNILQREYKDDYALTETESPYWAYTYADYYTRQEKEPGVYDYIPVEADELEPDWIEVTNITDEEWKDHYTEYYREWSDGVRVYRDPITAETKYNYIKQTIKPTEWKSSKGNFYILNDDWWYTYDVSMKVNGKWKVVATDRLRNIKMKEGVDATGRKYTLVSKVRNGNKYITLSEWCNKMHKKLSDYSWRKNRFYTQQSYPAPPDRFSMKVVWKNQAYSHPLWRANTYWYKTQVEVIPPFLPDTFYRRVEDRYASIVEQGIQRLNDIWTNDTIEVQLNPEAGEYDIGDVVGATDTITGISVSSVVTKKIVKYDGRVISIDYDVSPDKIEPVK